MDAELAELLRQFEAAQQAKSSVRLSERNVVELVNKLQELRIIDFDLLHTVSGKEYITLDQLKIEMESEIKRLKRVSLIELSDIIGMDLYYVERHAQEIVANSKELMLVQGEIISESYWDNVAEEINERLQECSQIALAELAAQLHVSSEMVASILEPRLGKTACLSLTYVSWRDFFLKRESFDLLSHSETNFRHDKLQNLCFSANQAVSSTSTSSDEVKARLEGGQLYTPLYVARINAMVRGAARGITVPTNLSVVWNSLQQLLQETDGGVGVSVEGSFFQSLFNGMLKEKEILGSIRAGIHWTPAVFAVAQGESVEAFFSQNSYISYDALHKLAIPQPKQYLQSRYHDGIPLETVFVHPSVVEMLDSAAEDAIEHGGWIDCLSVLPSFFGQQDVVKLFLHCPSLQGSLRNAKGIVLGETYIFSNLFIKDAFSQIEKKMDAHIQTRVSFGHGVHNSVRSSSGPKTKDDSGIGNDDTNSAKHMERGMKKRKGKSSGPSKAGGFDADHETLDNVTVKTKKKQGKTRENGSSQVLDVKPTTKKEAIKTNDELDSLSEEWISQQTLELFPDFEGLEGQEGEGSLVMALVAHLRPMLLSSWNQRRSAVLMASADRRRKLIDNMQKKIDESFLEIQLYEKALDLFESDPTTSVVLHRHLLRSMGAPLIDTLLLNLDMHNKLNTGGAVEELQTSEPPSFGSAERTSIAKSFPGPLSAKARQVIEALEGKQVDTFMNVLRELAEESGLSVKKLDKKVERTMLHSYHKDLLNQVVMETDPVALLPKVISLLYLQVKNKALQAPGRAISAAISMLKDTLDDSAYIIISEYHAATVTLLALQSAATTDEEDCTADRIASKREFLESRMPALEALVSGNQTTGLSS